MSPSWTKVADCAPDVSSTLIEPLEWENSTLVPGTPTRRCEKMKDTGDRSMRTIGSLTVCRSLLRAGRIDRFRVVTFPERVLAAGGDVRVID